MLHYAHQPLVYRVCHLRDPVTFLYFLMLTTAVTENKYDGIKEREPNHCVLWAEKNQKTELTGSDTIHTTKLKLSPCGCTPPHTSQVAVADFEGIS